MAIDQPWRATPHIQSTLSKPCHSHTNIKEQNYSLVCFYAKADLSSGTFSVNSHHTTFRGSCPLHPLRFPLNFATLSDIITGAISPFLGRHLAMTCPCRWNTRKGLAVGYPRLPALIKRWLLLSLLPKLKIKDLI